MKTNTKRIAALALGISLAMILSFVESQIPPLAAVPGVKIGLSNIVTVVLIYTYGWRDAGIVSISRIFLSALLFGNAVALIYSLSGGALSFAAMLLAKRFLPFGTVGVSVLGGVMHNVGQVIAAMVVMESAGVAVYLVPLLVSGTVAGVAVGIAAGIIAKRTERFL